MSEQTIWLPNSVMRERATVPATTRAALDAIDGFYVPIYEEEMPDGRRRSALGTRDFQRVIDGYACANGHCRALWKQRFDACPLCGHVPDLERDVVEDIPAYWKPGPSRTSEEILNG